MPRKTPATTEASNPPDEFVTPLETEQTEQTPQGDAPEINAELAAYITSLENALEDTEGCESGAWVDLYGVKTLRDESDHPVLDENGNPAKYLVKINLTSHARTPQAAFNNLIAAIQYAEAEFKFHPYDPTKPMAAVRPTPKSGEVRQPQPDRENQILNDLGIAPNAPAINQTSVPAAPRVPAQPTAPAAPQMHQATQPAQTGGGGVVNVERIVVSPRADGKASVAFWAAGRKFPDLTAVKTPERFAQEFSDATGAPWTAAHFQQAATYNIALVVKWLPGKTNAAGNPYKDIVSIELP